MPSLTDQLRGHATAFTPDGAIHGYISEAATRIEALEAALRAVIAANQVKVGAEPIDPNDRRGRWRDVIKDGQCARIAREALGESDA